MTNNNRPTLKDVYNVVNRLEDKMDKRLQGIEDDVECNTAFRNQLTGRVAMIAGVIGVVVNIVLNWFFRRIEL